MSTNMRAVILAAGRGTRLYPITLKKPKCLLEIGGATILNRQIRAIKEIGIEDIVVVVGHKKEAIMDAMGDTVRYREYADFAKTNNLHTLWSVREELNADFICIFADLIFDKEVVKRAKESRDEICLVVDTHRVLEGTMRIKLEKGRLTGVGSHIPVSEGSGNFIGIAKCSKKGAALLIAQMQKMVSAHQDDYYTIAIDALAKKGTKIGYVDISDVAWAEIDTKEDLDNCTDVVKNLS